MSFSLLSNRDEFGYSIRYENGGSIAPLPFGDFPRDISGVDSFFGSARKGMLIYKTPGTYTLTPTNNANVELLVVAGGGGGGTNIGSGGGAGSAGGDGSYNQGGDGGDGLEYFGYYYAGGGGAGAFQPYTAAGSGGLGGGGDSEMPGIDGTGGGGGGRAFTSSADVSGGNGIIIVRWGGYSKDYNPVLDTVS